MRAIKAVIFDMDGVLVDSEPLNFEVVCEVLARRGVHYTEMDNQAYLGVDDRDHFGALHERHRLGGAVQQLIDEATDLLLRLIPERTTPLPGVREVLDRLRQARYPLALGSSAAPSVIAARLGALGVRELFEVVVSGLEVARGKPAPDIFLTAAQRLGIPNDACLVVEDSPNGLLAARRAGMACVIVPSPATAGQRFDGATAELRTLRDLLPLLLPEESHR